MGICFQHRVENFLSCKHTTHLMYANKDSLPIIYTLLAMNVICSGLGTSLQ